MITLVFDELLRLLEAESATKSLREARAGPELNPRVVCSGLSLSEQGPSLGTRMCLANFLEVAGVGGGWGQAPLSPGSQESPLKTLPPPHPTAAAALPPPSALLLCLSVCHSVSRVCADMPAPQTWARACQVLTVFCALCSPGSD